MAFRKKAGAILQYKPDILIVQECEHPDKLIFANAHEKPKHVLWIGTNRSKGLGIFSYSGLKIKLLKTYNTGLRLIAPIKISNGQNSITLFAIWAHNPEDKDGRYITQVWKALKHYKRSIKGSKTILAGDFNSNTVWDRPHRDGNHSDVVKKLEDKNIYSVYHKYFSQQQGKETHPTHYLYRHQQRAYHLDYCFVSGDLLDNLISVEIGDYETWRLYSDHVPVIVSLNALNI